MKVDSGANCELRSKDGRTAAEVAEQNLRDEAAQVLNGCRKHVEEEAVEGEGGAKNKTMKTNTTGEFQWFFFEKMNKFYEAFTFVLEFVELVSTKK